MPVIKEVAKLWGTELWHHNDAQYCMKTLLLQHGAQSSLHYHKVKRETFLVTYGVVEIQRDADGVWHRLEPGDSITIHPGVAHRFRAATTVARVVEASTMHDDADVYRIEESTVLPLQACSTLKRAARR